MTDRKPGPPRPIGASADDGDKDTDAGKPTPVRRFVAEVHGTAGEVEFPGREFEVDGARWWIQELGRTRSGRREDRGAVLILAGFRPLPAREGDDPGERGDGSGEGGADAGGGGTADAAGAAAGGSGSESDGGEWEREAWIARDSLEELSPLELEEALRSARPFRPVPDEPPPFFGPRGRRGRRDSSRGRQGGRR